MGSEIDPAERAPVASAVSRLGPGVLLVLLTALISGVSTFLNGYAVQGTSSDAFVTVRNAFVAGMVLPIAILGRRRGALRLSARDGGALALVGLVGGAVPFLLFFRGLQLATEAGGATTASFVYRTLFLFATVLGVVVLRERLPWRAVVGAALLLLGNLLLMALTSPIWTDGSLYVLAATALWAAEYTISKSLLGRLPSGTVAAGRMGFGAIFLLGYLGISEGSAALVGFSFSQWGWVLLSSLLLTGFVTTWYAGLKRTDLGIATSILVMGYPVTWLLAVALRSSPIAPGALLGAMIVGAGVLVAVGWGAWRETGRWVARALARRTLHPA